MGMRFQGLIMVCSLILPILILTHHGESLNRDLPVLDSALSVSYYNSTTVYIEENITVGEGEELVIDNSRLVFNCSHDGEFRILVHGGNFTIRNGSRLEINRTSDTSNNGGFNYNLVFISSNVRISDTVISNSGWGIGSGSALHAKNCNLSMENVTLDGMVQGLFLEGKGYSITNCTFIGSTENALEPRIEEGRIVGNRFDNCSYSIRCTSGITEKTNISRNMISGGMIGIEVRTPLNCMIFDNTISDQKGFGIGFRNRYYNVDTNIVTQNRIINCTTGISAEGEKCIVTKNMIDNCNCGIEVRLMTYQKPTAARIIDNIIRNCSNGLELYSLKDDTVSGNRFENISGIGVDNPYGCRNLSLTDNRFEGCGTAGIKTANIEGFEMDGCVFSNCHTGFEGALSSSEIISCIFNNCSFGLISNVTEGSIKDCVFSECRDGSVFSNMSQFNIIGNYYSNGSTGLNLNVTNGRIESNFFISLDVGIDLFKASDCPISGNVFLENGVGISIGNQYQNTRFHLNDFVENEIHLRDKGPGFYFHGFKGNYWSGMSNYTDSNGDGIVDHPYVIDEDSLDRYPLTAKNSRFFNRPVSIQLPEEATIQQMETINVHFSCQDDDDDHHTYTLFPERNVDYSFDGETGYFSFTPTLQDLGVFRFHVNVTDNNGSCDSGIFTVNVIHFNYPPELEGPSTFERTTGTTQEIVLNTKDRNGDNVTAILLDHECPFGIQVLHMRILRFNATREEIGTYHLRLGLFDNNGSTTSCSLTLIVMPGNRPPSLEVGMVFFVDAGELFNRILRANDPDGDIVIFSPGNIWLDSLKLDSDGRLKFNPDRGHIGVHDLRVNLSDNNGSRTTGDFTIVVLDPNRPPEGPEHVNLTCEAGDSITVTLKVSDPDLDEIRLEVIDGITVEWMQISDLRIDLHPTISYLGILRWTIRVWDICNSFHDIELNLNVIMGPKLELIVPEEVTLNEREVLWIPIRHNYRGNGTVELSMEGPLTGDSPFTLADWSLRAAPSDGDHGTYSFRLIASVVNGRSSEPYSLVANILWNLSTLNVDVSLNGIEDEVFTNTRLSGSLRHNGYSGPLEFQWYWWDEDSLIQIDEGNSSTVYANLTGKWDLFIRIGGVDEVVFHRSFSVIEKGDREDGRDFRGALVILIAIISLLIAIPFSVKLVRRISSYREEYRKTIDKGAKELPEGFKAAPKVHQDSFSTVMGDNMRENSYEKPLGLPTHERADR
jgi:parallel beta-helix repeat protein